MTHLQKNVEEIPSLEVFANSIIAGIRRQRDIADRLITSIIEKKLDVIALGQFFRMAKFDQLEARDAVPTRTEYLSPNAVQSV